MRSDIQTGAVLMLSILPLSGYKSYLRLKRSLNNPFVDLVLAPVKALSPVFDRLRFDGSKLELLLKYLKQRAYAFHTRSNYEKVRNSDTHGMWAVF